MFDRDENAKLYGTTPVENIFLTDYLPSAKGDYVKVYLMVLYHSQAADEEMDVPGLAGEMNMPIPLVEEALRYWERRGLIMQQSDGNYRLFSTVELALGRRGTIKADDEYIEFSETVYRIFGDEKKITPSDISKAYEWIEDLHMTQGAVLVLLNHLKATTGCRFTFARADRIAAQMKDAGVVSAEDAEHYLQFESTLQSGAQAVLRRFNKRRLPSDDEIALYRKWSGEWGFAPDAILRACAETTAAGDPSFRYLDKILERIHNQSSARTSAQVDQCLTQEKDEMSRFRDFQHAMGLPASSDAGLAFYRSMLTNTPHDVILLAARECAARGQMLDSVESLITWWAENGLRTKDQIEPFLAQQKKDAAFMQQVFTASGVSKEPSRGDLQTLALWRAKGYSDELILCAAEKARDAHVKKSAYMDTVLKNWQEEGIKTPQDICPRPAAKPAQARKVVSAQKYTQREYTEQQLQNAVDDDLFKEVPKP